MDMHNRCARVAPRLAPLAVAVALCLASHAHAATFTMTTGNTVEAPGKCTLEDAISLINSPPTGAYSGACTWTGTFGDNDTIKLGNYVYDIGTNTSVVGAPMSADSALVLNKPMTLIGSLGSDGSPRATIQRDGPNSGSDHFRVIQTNSDLTLIGVSVQNGIVDALTNTSGWGGGILATGTSTNTIALTLVNSSVSGNQSHGTSTKYSLGGGICAIYANVVLRNSTVGPAGYYDSGNSAFTAGGMAVLGNVSVYSSTISGNTATGGKGGGIYSAGTGTATIVNSTFSGNYAKGGGGGIDANSVLVSSSTFVGNTTVAGKAGGGVLIAAQSEIDSSLMVGNSPGNDVDAPSSGVQLTANYDSFKTTGGNITLSATSAHNKACSAAPSALGFNGGPTRTMALTLPANACEIDAGTASSNGLASDQRGALYERRSGVATDIGAFEYQPANDRIFYDGFESP